MNRGLNLPQIQRIMTEFEKESSMMDMKEEMMSDAVDDVMDEEEDEEEEGDKILKQVLDEIGVDLSQQVYPSSCLLISHITDCYLSLRMRLLVSQLLPNHWQIGNLWLLVTKVVFRQVVLEVVLEGVIWVVEAVVLFRTKTPYKPDLTLYDEVKALHMRLLVDALL